MANGTIYTMGFHPFCYHAKKLLDSKGLPYLEIDFENGPSRPTGNDAANQ